MLNLKTTRFHSIAIVLAVCLVGAALWFFKEPIWMTIESMVPKTVQDMNHSEHSMSDRDAPQSSSSRIEEPGQVPAMVSPGRQQLTGMKTALVSEQTLQTEIRAVGMVEYDEQRITHVNLRLTGWVEDLFVDYTGQAVRQGDPLFTLYSQELVAAQEEFLLAVQTQSDTQDSPLVEVREQGQQLVDAARDRLRLWTITDHQISDLIKRGTPQTYVTIYSPATGFVIDKQVFKGMYVKPDITVYTIADLSTVWVHADIFEYELPFIRVGQTGLLTLDAYPDDTFRGDITYIYPYLKPKTRTVKVRFVFSNPSFRLKPAMYGTVHIQVNRGTRLAIPEEAVLDSGTRTIVFVVKKEGVFEPREITVGAKVGSYYEIISGLQRGERIVTSGTFLLDSESKLMASTNMMGALGMGGVKMEQAHMGQMDMPGMNMNGMDGKSMATQKPGESIRGMAGPIKKKTGGLTLRLTTLPTPPQVGENRIHLVITDANDQPVTQAQVQLALTMPMPGMRPVAIPMTSTIPGSYEAMVQLGMSGQWHLNIVIQRTGHPDIQETFPVETDNGHPSDMSGMLGM